MDAIETKVENLKKQLSDFADQPMVVAFSGGVDSSLLLSLAVEAAEQEETGVYAIRLDSNLYPIGDAKKAEQIALESGAIFMNVPVDPMGQAGIRDNPRDRCYRCKRYLYEQLVQKKEALGAGRILDGTNADDAASGRPGLQAIRELSVDTPLADAGLTKEEVRELARERRLSVADRPASPCLATRFPYGTRLSEADFRRVEAGEDFLRSFGLYNVRLRVHQDVARLETDAASFPVLMEHRAEIVARIQGLGFRYVTLDLEGFRSGSMDDVREDALDGSSRM